MLFQLHDEKIIGFKQLSESDLGTGETSHQTHIGLFGDVLTFLPNPALIDNAILIFGEKMMTLPVEINKIENPDSSTRSPKIKSAYNDEKTTNTITKQIRNIVATVDPSIKWYMFWFGLSTQQPVFYLFNEKMQAYSDIIYLEVPIQTKLRLKITEDAPYFQEIFSYLTRNINKTGETYLKELEIAVLSNRYDPTKLGHIDFEQAKKDINEYNRASEYLVYKYLKNLMIHGEIISLTWENEKENKHLPYDFRYITPHDEEIHVVVKTTAYDFNQKILFDNREINYISHSSKKFKLYRVYADNESIKMKVADSISEFLSEIDGAIYGFAYECNYFGGLESLIISINSNNENSLSFNSEILLKSAN